MSQTVTNTTFLALGANKPGNFGTPLDAFRQGCRLLARNAVFIRSRSSIYSTAPFGGSAQPAYFNAVVEVETRLTAFQLLRVLKAIERLAGRRRRGLNTPRPIDIDIISMGGFELGWRQSRRTSKTAESLRQRPGVSRRHLMVPHPEAHLRRFVLVPLAEIAPGWRHPVLGATVRELLARLPRRRGDVKRVLDSDWCSCENVARK